MKRTLKYIFNTITVVSLLLMIGTAGLWVDGYWYRTMGQVTPWLSAYRESAQWI